MLFMQNTNVLEFLHERYRLSSPLSRWAHHIEHALALRPLWLPVLARCGRFIPALRESQNSLLSPIYVAQLPKITLIVYLYTYASHYFGRSPSISDLVMSSVKKILSAFTQP